MFGRFKTSPITDQEQLKILREAIEKGEIKLIKKIVNKGFNINLKYDSGITPMMDAAMQGQWSIAQFLLNNGADINIKDEKVGNTILIWATLKQTKIESMGNLFINIHKMNQEYGITHGSFIFYILFTLQENIEFIKNIIEKGADINEKDMNGIDLLYRIIDSSYISVLKLWCEKTNLNSANIDEKRKLIEYDKREFKDTVPEDAFMSVISCIHEMKDFINYAVDKGLTIPTNTTLSKDKIKSIYLEVFKSVGI